MECIVHHCKVGDRTSAWPRYTGGCTDLVVPRASFERSLGMRTDAELDRQLAIDLPRSEVWTAAGARCLSPAQARAATPYARCVTQAVCAPALEWFAHAGVHARELARPHPLRVDILPCGSVSARKRLMLSVGVIEVSVFVTERLVVVSSNPAPRGRRRTSPRGDDGGRRAGARRRPRTAASPQRLAPVAKAHDESAREEGVE